VVKYSGAARYLRVRLETDGYGILTNSTAGAITGHAMATNAFAVAATRVNLAYPNLFTTNNTVEYFSSDGPRRVFFNADGTAITPNNFTSTGGALRLKPDITAANGVATSVPGFSAFYGTSAAAPHAAALAALLWSYDPALTPAQIRFALTNTALDIGAAGFDRDAGAGIVMASSSLQSVAAQFFTPAVTSFSATNGGDPRVAWNSASNHVYQLQYTAALAPANWQNLGASITSTGGVISASDPAAADPARFYRVQLVH
jgi:subtilisin family serine protease